MTHRNLTTEEFLSVNPPTTGVGGVSPSHVEELKENFLVLLACSEKVRDDANAEIERIEAILAILHGIV